MTVSAIMDEGGQQDLLSLALLDAMEQNLAALIASANPDKNENAN